MYKRQDIRGVVEILRVHPYSAFLDYITVENAVKLVTKVLDEIIKDPLKMDYVEVIDILRKPMFGFLDVSKLREWGITERLEKIWLRVQDILQSTEDFINYVSLYAKFSESVFKYYLKEYSNIDAKLPPLEYIRLMRMLIKSIEEGRRYEELLNAISILRKINREMGRKLKSVLKYHYRKLKG